MMRKHQLLLAALALCWAMAAGAAQAAGQNVYEQPSPWATPGWEASKQEGVVRGYEDGSFRAQWPCSREEANDMARNAGRVAASQEVDGLEDRVGDIEGRVDGHDVELRRQAQSYGGPSYPPNDPAQTTSGVGSTTINYNFNAPPTPPPPAPVGTPPPSGGDQDNTKPADEPTEGRTPMNPWTVLGIIIIGGGAVVGAIVLFQYVAVALRRRRREDDIELDEQQRRLDERLVAGQVTALDALSSGSDDYPAEEYSAIIRTSQGVVGRRKGKRTAADYRRAVEAAAAGP